jgi:hypothetical protein
MITAAAVSFPQDALITLGGGGLLSSVLRPRGDGAGRWRPVGRPVLTAVGQIP